MTSSGGAGRRATRADRSQSGITGMGLEVPAEVVVISPVNEALLPVFDDLRRCIPAIWSSASPGGLAQDTPDLVVVAPTEPTGALEISRLLREHWKDQLVPLVLLMPSADPAVTALAYGEGVDFLWSLGEPFDVLQARVQSLLRLRALLSLVVRSRERAKSRVRDHEQWSRFLVHDLRSPLAALTSGIDSLRTVEALSEDDVAFCDQLLLETRRLSWMVSDLLDFERISDGRLRVERAPIDVGEVAERVITTLRPTAKEQGVTMCVTRVSESTVASVDAGLLERVLANLACNALRHSPGGKTVVLEVGAADGWLSVSVLNAGPTIPVGFREKIFEPYVQLYGQAIQGASGLGLAFCRAVIQAHGGEIRVTDRDQLVCFVVSVPISPG